jgi:hypothetical protein
VTSDEHTDDEIVAGYLQSLAEGGGGESFWAYEEVVDLSSVDPEKAWLLALSMISRTSDEILLAAIAAGPLEDILCWHGHQFIDRVEALAVDDAHFRDCLRSVWGHLRMEPAIYARVRRAVDGPGTAPLSG